MRELVERLDALCDAVPFHASWYLKDTTTGARADRLGDVPVPSASTRKISIMMATLSVVHAGKLALDQKVTIEARYQDNDSGAFQHLTPGFSITLRDALVDDDHRQRQHVHRADRGSRGAGRDPALLRGDRDGPDDSSVRHPAAPGSRSLARAGHDDDARRPGAPARAPPARRDRSGGGRSAPV